MIKGVNSSNPVKERIINERLGYVNRSNDFGKILRDQIKESSELKFSKHAQERAAQRGIDVTPKLMDDLQNAVEKAKEKGARELAIIGSNEAFIVNVTNGVVVTTMSSLEMKNNIFTNIDSAVII
ncbi:TIGR02530 family flagellar biosynthesis protein [Proteocatella sphenisci]|uniref:TIGR02530 family flagellar biosynthesis protein n=1 Tax=Proteocatella sphenisci TaxID=181070 RepID=UPI0004AC991F|nr:TIGR02530 family flagellar biosynthesis protein [Proteocatella sphenisci]